MLCQETLTIDNRPSFLAAEACYSGFQETSRFSGCFRFAQHFWLSKLVLLQLSYLNPLERQK